MKLSRTRPSHDAPFDLTAMVDIVLLLIIFFTFTTQFAALTGTPLDLPNEKGEEISLSAKAKTLIVDLTSTGQLIVLGRPISSEAFAVMAKRERELAGEALEIVIRADRNASASHLNAIASALAAQNVRTWKLATAPGG